MATVTLNHVLIFTGGMLTVMAILLIWALANAAD
jgi:hypothetical protein